MFNQIATRNTKEKKAWQAELARKLDANVRVTNFRVLFAAYRARVQGPLALEKSSKTVQGLKNSRPNEKFTMPLSAQVSSSKQ